jgi:hypothetical protein
LDGGGDGVFGADVALDGVEMVGLGGRWDWFEVVGGYSTALVYGMGLAG